MKGVCFLLILVLLGCEVDQLPACEGPGIEGQVCKEYQYLFGVYNGVNEYEYDLGLGLLSAITTKTDNGSVEGIKSYSYNQQGQLTSILLKDSKGQLLNEKILYYNNSGLLEKEVISGNSKTKHEYYYDGDLLKVEVFYLENVIDWVDSIEHYSGTKDIYRKLRYVNNSLKEITYFDLFSNNVLEEKVLDNYGLIQSKKVIRFNDRQEKIEEIVYSSNNTIVNKVVYTYIDSKLYRVDKFNELDEEYEVLTYTRY